jgi:hypothetical protein|tara:strand:+ start:2279 stop:2476 length:198 start_codon:yes stop_codon:yes gene_type:complete
MTISSEGFFEHKCKNQESRIHQLEHQCSELTLKYNEMSERVKKLATRQPEWPQGYSPRRKFTKRV